MSDQCRHCTLKGDWKSCKSEDCGHHDNWGWKQLEKENQTLRAQVDDLQYANHRQQILIDVMNKTDKRFIAEIEAAAVEEFRDENLDDRSLSRALASQWATSRRKEAQK